MLKNALSLNRLANVFHVILKHAQEYENNLNIWTKDQKLQKLERILHIINICIDVIDRKTKLKGISKDFVSDAREIKKKQIGDDRNWYDYLDVREWFK